MNTRIIQLLLATVAVAALATAALWAAAQTDAHRLDADAIGQAAGTKATTKPDGVVRLEWARKDVKVTVDGMTLKPAAGLGSWAAFTAAPHGAMVMGDTVVFQDEVTPAMDAAFAHSLEVTALHNHFFFDEPKVYFMHIGGHGDPVKLAQGVKAVWDAIKKVRAEHATPAKGFGGEVPKEGKINAEAIARTLGHKGQTKDGVVKVSIGREGTMHKVKVGESMGLNTWAAFSGSDDLAAVDGDFIMTAREVQPVLRALRKADIHIVALHNHMIGEHPAFYFTHFWGKGPAQELARGLKSALDAQEQAGRHAASGEDSRLKSGPQHGHTLPGPFNPLNVTNVERPGLAGTRSDYVEQHGNLPVVLVFARDVSSPVAQLVKRLNAEVGKNQPAKLRAVVVVLSEDEDLEGRLKDLAEKQGIGKVSLAISTPLGPKQYNLATEAEVTIVVYKRYKVTANHAFKKGDLTSTAIDRVMADVSQVAGN
jgi:hypothetical protein